MSENGTHLLRTFDAVLLEAHRANARYGLPTSTHESLGVLIEEMDELREAVRGNILVAVEREAIQIAAVAIRLADACHRAVASDGTDAPTPFLLRSLP